MDTYYKIYITIGKDEFLPWKNLTEEQMWEHMLDMSPLKVITWLVKHENINVFDHHSGYNCCHYKSPITITVFKGTAQFWKIDLIPAERVEALVKLVQDKQEENT